MFYIFYKDHFISRKSIASLLRHSINDNQLLMVLMTPLIGCILWP